MSKDFMVGFAVAALPKYYVVALLNLLVYVLIQPSVVALVVLGLLWGFVFPWVYLVIAYLLFRSRVIREPIEGWLELPDREKGRKAAELGTRW